ncbi:hypothetical protein [Ornithobacterium rhinotracheale]|uniref:hypothetical protein n=1 Tax=Ornithobacterium rhinotracheale TaxID=28251 RepID=UPI002158B9A5|nr:hypothetical protein [Ornithobacterium rhinotracheale]UVD87979.1 hypothetical protein NV236_03770 [Ornithobacterium rhinotracheale]
MKKTMLSLGVFALMGLSTQVFGQVETATEGPLSKDAVGINTDEPTATLDVNGGARVRKARAAVLPESKVKATEILVVDKDGNLLRLPISATTLADLVKDTPAAGGGTGPSTPGGATGKTPFTALTGNIRIVEHITKAEWDKPDTFCLVQTGKQFAELPEPKPFEGRVISINNQSGTKIGFKGSNVPENATTLMPGHGMMIMSNGEAWYMIGGGY